MRHSKSGGGIQASESIRGNPVDLLSGAQGDTREGRGEPSESCKVFIWRLNRKRP
jgi:hypothetical protein